MNRSLIVLLLALPFFTACKREYALVQPAKPDFFVQKQRAKANKEAFLASPIENKKEVINEIFKVEALPDNYAVLENEEMTQLASQKPIIGGGKKKRQQVQRRSAATFLKQVFPNQQLKETPKKHVKKKKKKRVRWNSMIPAGFIFLGIAILLAFINLNGLALLFGVASILFLFLGFKKLFRKKRRRSIFK